MHTPSVAPRNRTIRLTDVQCEHYKTHLVQLCGAVQHIATIANCTIHQDVFDVLDWLPTQSVDLVVADPPYNITKSFHGTTFKQRSVHEYEAWLQTWLPHIARILKPTGSLYICGDWRSAAAIQSVAAQHFIIQNRITWEREKGRGSHNNWKNCAEDIWFCTMSHHYTFHVEQVKIKRRVMAPYTTENGNAKDWAQQTDGRFRLTHPSNVWTDITVPFWSMPENTDHPTQKPEKLFAKIILASTHEHDIVFDPFVGSGTTSVVAKKLGRQYIGVEQNEYYCCLAEHRLQLAHDNPQIQGYADGVFWERNALKQRHTLQQKPK